MRTSNRRPIATTIVLLGAMTLFAGCGDQGQHLPAGMTGSSAAYSGATGNDLVDDVLGGDPGPQTAGVSTMVDDPVLAGYDGIDSLSAGSLDDPYSRASADWAETEGSLGGLDDMSMDDFDDDLMPVGYGGGYGDGWGNDVYGLGTAGYGYGNGIYGAAAYGGFEDAGMMDAGFDPGLEDPGLMDAGFDPGFEDPGFVDAGFDAGMIDPGMDAGVMDAGMDAGFVDPGFVDVGGFDAGIADVGMADVGMDAGIVF